jgi:hypothetical protein
MSRTLAVQHARVTAVGANRAFAENLPIPLTTMFGGCPPTGLWWRGSPGLPLETLSAELTR